MEVIETTISSQSQQDIHWMQHAFTLAEKARSLKEIPVGAVLIHENKIIGKGWNCPITSADPSAHAEIIALRQAGNTLNNYRLNNTTLYVTLEPCAMCAMAMVHARIQRLIFATEDPKTGAVCSVFRIFDEEKINHRVSYQGGVLKDSCSQLLKEFFRVRRK